MKRVEGASRAEEEMVVEPTPVIVSQQLSGPNILNVKKMDFVAFIAMFIN